jgi:hypothetical protein
MANIIGMLTPTATTSDEQSRISMELNTDGLNYAKELADKGEEPDFAELDELNKRFTAHLIYSKLRVKYMTWDRLRQVLRESKNLDDGIKYLLQRGLIKEVFVKVED